MLKPRNIPDYEGPAEPPQFTAGWRCTPAGVDRRTHYFASRGDGLARSLCGYLVEMRALSPGMVAMRCSRCVRAAGKEGAS